MSIVFSLFLFALAGLILYYMYSLRKGNIGRTPEERERQRQERVSAYRAREAAEIAAIEAGELPPIATAYVQPIAVAEEGIVMHEISNDPEMGTVAEEAPDLSNVGYTG